MVLDDHRSQCLQCNKIASVCAREQHMLIEKSVKRHMFYARDHEILACGLAAG